MNKILSLGLKQNIIKSTKTVFTVVVVFAFLFSGCLTAEKKEYKVQLRPDGSGTMTIRYINIMHNKYTEEDTPEKDWEELQRDYLNGTKLQEEFPNARVLSAKLSVEDGKLVGTVDIEFSKLQDVKFYQYDSDSPLMYYVNSINESFLESNGMMNADIMPVVFWPKETRSLTLLTGISGEISPDDTSYISLTPFYLKNK